MHALYWSKQAFFPLILFFLPLIGFPKEQGGGALRSLTSYRSNNRKKKTPLRRVKCELLAHMDYF